LPFYFGALISGADNKERGIFEQEGYLDNRHEIEAMLHFIIDIALG
jgi:hypothetical protein